MSTEEQARGLMAQHRQHKEHLHDSMLSRAEAAEPENPHTQEQARELMAQYRQHKEHLHDSMLSRAEAEIGVPQETTDTSQ